MAHRGLGNLTRQWLVIESGKIRYVNYIHNSYIRHVTNYVGIAGVHVDVGWMSSIHSSKREPCEQDDAYVWSCGCG